MAKFETGKTYFTRSVGDHDCIYKFEILKRTEKSVWVRVHDEIVRRAIEVHGSAEAFYPHGKYSMAAVISANRPLESEPEPVEVETPIKQPLTLLHTYRGPCAPFNHATQPQDYQHQRPAPQPRS